LAFPEDALGRGVAPAKDEVELGMIEHHVDGVERCDDVEGTGHEDLSAVLRSGVDPCDRRDRHRGTCQCPACRECIGTGFREARDDVGVAEHLALDRCADGA
jgi:hypothetical protein